MKFLLKLLFSIFVFIALFLPEIFVLASTTNGTATGSAWSKNIGWVNFGITGGNIVITDSTITGNVWNKYFGWIKLDPTTSGVVNDGEGNLSGYAFAKNLGWINFSGVTINSSGRFLGTATGTNISEINFSCTNCVVTTDWRPISSRSVSCGDGTCNGNETCSNCANDCGICYVGGDSGSFLKPSITHKECNFNQQCVQVNGPGSDFCQIDLDCNIYHTECVDLVCAFKSGPGFNQCQSNNECFAPVHKECNLQGQCVLVQGSGLDQCYNNDSCSFASPAALIVGVTNNKMPPPNPSNFNEVNENKNEFIFSKEPKTPQKVAEKKDIFQEIANPEVAWNVIKNAKEIINAKEISFVVWLISIFSFAVVVASYVPNIIFAAQAFPEAFIAPIKILGLLLSAFGLRKKIAPWGIVYDSFTKRPVVFAEVILKDQNGIQIAKTITDLNGYYKFYTQPGFYQIFVKKVNYIFPSQKNAEKQQDEVYSNLYFGDKIYLPDLKNIKHVNIPLDKNNFNWQNFYKKNKAFIKFQIKIAIFLKDVYSVFFAVGIFVGLFAFLANPSAYNSFVLCLYLVLFLLGVLNIKQKSFGYIIDKETKDPLPFSIIRIMHYKYDIELVTKVTDKFGRYHIILPKGKYLIKIEKKNENGSYSLPYVLPVFEILKTEVIDGKFIL